jgi:hypothetical protein
MSLRATRHGAAAALLCALASSAAAQPSQVERVHHELDVELDPAARELQVLDRIELRGHGLVEVRLAQAFPPRQATLDGTALPAPRAEGGQWVWTVDLTAGHGHRLVLE